MMPIRNNNQAQLMHRKDLSNDTKQEDDSNNNQFLMYLISGVIHQDLVLQSIEKIVHPANFLDFD